MSLLTNIVNVGWMPRQQRVVNQSPFTGRRQHGTLRFHRWEFVVEYARTRGQNAVAKIAALAALRGGDVSFNFRDPSRASPSTGFSGVGAINSSASGFSIPVDGLANNTLILRAGDYFSILIAGEHQLFTAAADATTNGSGEVTIATDNPVRGTAANNDVVTFTNWLVTVTLEDKEQYGIDRQGLLVLPALKFVEDF